MNLRCVGSFSISDSLLQDIEKQRLVQEALAEVFITQATHNFATRQFDYIGVSDHFEEVEAGKCMGEYILTFHLTEYGEPYWAWEAVS